MTRAIFWGSSERQFDSLPQDVQESFEWAIDQLVQNPPSLPESSSKLMVVTAVLSGPLDLQRIKIRRHRDDPGYRGIYFLDADGLVFLRFTFRDKATYKGLKALAQKARTQLGLE